MITRILLWVVMMTLAIVQNPTDGSGIELRGAAAQFWKSKAPEIILDGPANTGKSFACCVKLHALCCKYPGVQTAIIRQVRADMAGSVLQTYEGVVGNNLGKSGDKLGDGSNDTKPVIKIGGETVKAYQYWNGSRIWVGGLDRPGSVLSAERDFIYICQAEQIKLAAYEYITSRCEGRAGNSPYPQILMDSNPDHPKHWLLDRVKSGKLLMLKSKHKDNPTLWDGKDWTERGKRSIQALKNLTGVRYKRLYLGIWCGVEGLVYEEFDLTIHQVKAFEIPSDWQRYIIIDWGYRDPMCVQWWATRGDYAVMYREIYTSGDSVEDVAQHAGILSKGEKIELCISDHDPQKKITFKRNFAQEYGKKVRIVNADKELDLGIQDVEKSLKTDGEGIPFIRYFNNALVKEDCELKALHLPTSTVDEYACYAWPEDVDGKPRKEVPVDRDNHGMDCTRYFVRYKSKLKRRESRPKASIAS